MRSDGTWRDIKNLKISRTQLFAGWRKHPGKEKSKIIQASVFGNHYTKIVEEHWVGIELGRTCQVQNTLSSIVQKKRYNRS